MVEVLPGTAGVAPTSLVPLTTPVVPPGADPTSRTERATRAARESNETQDHQERVVEDRVEVREQRAADDRRARRKDDQRTSEFAQIRDQVEQERQEESAARDKHSVDFNV